MLTMMFAIGDNGSPLTDVMPGHRRSKNGVASLAYAPGIHVLSRMTKEDVEAGTSPAMTAVTQPT
jgi:hypothetical protein